MKHYLILILAILVLVSGLFMGCSPGLQTYDKYGMSFKVANALKLEEYIVNLR